MSKKQMLTGHSINYRDCHLIPLLICDTHNGEKIQGYGFATVYMGLNATSYLTFKDEWLSSVEGAIAVGKAQIDLDALMLKHCIVEHLR